MNPPGWRGWPRGPGRKQRALTGKLGWSAVRARGALGNFHCKTLTTCKALTTLHWECWKWDFSSDFYPAKLRGFLCVFLKNRNSKRHICNNTKFTSKERDTGVSQSAVIRWWWLFFVWLNNIFSLNPTWPLLAESHRNNKGKSKPAWNRYPTRKILGSTLHLANL